MVRALTLTSYLVLVMLSPMQLMACVKMTDLPVVGTAQEMGTKHEQMTPNCHKKTSADKVANSKLALDCFLSCASSVSSVSDMPIDFQKPFFVQIQVEAGIINHVLPPHTSQLFRPPIA